MLCSYHLQYINIFVIITISTFILKRPASAGIILLEQSLPAFSCCDNMHICIKEKTLEFSASVLPASYPNCTCSTFLLITFLLVTINLKTVFKLKNSIDSRAYCMPPNCMALQAPL